MSVINNELTCMLLALTGCVPLNARRRSASCVIEVSKATQLTTQLDVELCRYKRGLSKQASNDLCQVNGVNGGDTVFVRCVSVCVSVRSGSVNQTSLGIKC